MYTYGQPACVILGKRYRALPLQASVCFQAYVYIMKSLISDIFRVGVCTLPTMMIDVQTAANTVS